MLLVIILAVIVTLLFVYSLVSDTGKNTKFARKEAHAKTHGSAMEPADLVELN